MSIAYTLTDKSLSLVLGHTPYTIPRSHQNWDKIIDALNDNEPVEILDGLVNVAKPIAEFLSDSPHVELAGRTLLFNGRVIDNNLTRRVLQHIDAGKPGLAAPLVRFLERVMNNPSYRAVQGLFEWVEKSGLPITSEGKILAYKIVGPTYFDLRSNSFDHSIGKVVEQPRNLCDEDPDRTCSAGIHFCSAEYLPHYGTAEGNHVMIVEIDPADVCAFPRDYNISKGRCCRLEVVGEVPRETAAQFFGDDLVYDWAKPELKSARSGGRGKGGKL